MTTGPPDVRVRRCTVRVRRHGGWSWGDPAAYVDEAVASVERALEALVAEAGVAPDVDLTLSAPLSVEVGPDGRPTRASVTAAAQVLRAAAAAVVRAVEPAAERPAGAPGATPAPPGRSEALTDEGRRAAALALLGTLARWSRSGTLPGLLTSWPSSVVEAWVAAVHAGASAPGARRAGMASAAVESIANSVLAAPAAPRPADASRGFLLLTGAVAAALGDGVLPDAKTLAVVAQASGAPLPATQASGAAEGPRARAPTPPAQGPTAAEHPEPPRAAIVPALPFLVLVQLHRLAYAEAAIAALAAAGVVPAGASYAAIAAGAALDPPAHGWRRSPDERRTVELASGLTADGVDGALAACADRAALLQPPLGSALVELYALSRRRAEPLEVTSDGGDLVCGEARGALPLAWCGSRAQLEDVLRLLGGPPVLESDRFADVAAALRDHRAFPGRDVPGLERVARAVVGTALGTLAQELWGGDSDVVTALHRLGDLEARVEPGDRTRIGIPRGQRWLDLRRVGLLDAWPAPWTPDGVWELVTW